MALQYTQAITVQSVTAIVVQLCSGYLCTVFRLTVQQHSSKTSMQNRTAMQISRLTGALSGSQRDCRQCITGKEIRDANATSVTLHPLLFMWLFNSIDVVDDILIAFNSCWWCFNFCCSRKCFVSDVKKFNNDVDDVHNNDFCCCRCCWMLIMILE